MNYRSLLSATLLSGSLILVGLIPGRLISSPSGGHQHRSTQATGGAIKVAIPAARDALSSLQTAAQTEVATQLSAQTGAYTFVRSATAEPLVADEVSAAPQRRAAAFLATHGGLIGMSEAERQAASAGHAPANGSELRVAKSGTDSLGMHSVRYDQFHKGVRVFGAQVIVHMNDKGIRAVNGHFVPGIALSTIPALTEGLARDIAVVTTRKEQPGAEVKGGDAELAIYPSGLLEGSAVRPALAYAVEVSSPHREQVWVDAQTGGILARIPLEHSALNRRVYTPNYDPANPDSNVVHEEGDLVPPPNPATPTSNLYHFSAHSYNFFKSAFGRESYDGIGEKPQRTVYMVDPNFCPNAAWSSTDEVTLYCPDFDRDDIVAHEWGHAYTTFTHNLIYYYQSGALNEAYSDIFGETVDLHNGTDFAGGSANNAPTTYSIERGRYVPSGGGVRWRIGEDLTGLSQPAALGISRDMWTPLAFGDPDKVSSPAYHCAPSDTGGVHTNSGVVNHAFAMLVDGTAAKPDGKFNGVTVQPIGFVRALNIYFRAMTNYQVSTSNFADHEQALKASCTDLIGAPLTNFSTDSAERTPSEDVITADTCQQVANAMAAVEMSREVAETCELKRILDPNTPAQCGAAATFFTEDWESGMDGWTVANEGTGEEWPGNDWVVRAELPANLDDAPRAGSAIFSSNPRIGEPNGGDCSENDVTGQRWIDSPEITIPGDATDPKLAFEHYVYTEREWDGGNVKVSVNGGDFAVVPTEAYAFNPPNFTAPAGNPLETERIWNGSNQGEHGGSWGTTIVNLSSIAKPGDKVRIRFDFGQDACNGELGWFIDTVRLYNCPTVEAPTLSTGAGYENPDTDGSFQLTWERPAGATAPDRLQESTSCGPLVFEDAEAGLTEWTVSAEGQFLGMSWQEASDKPNHSSQTFRTKPTEEAESASAILTYNNAIAVPSNGATTLTFRHWYFGESDDRAYVEVSEDGTNWVIADTDFRSPASIANVGGATAFATEALFTRVVDLTAYAGKTIHLRFRHFVGNQQQPGQQVYGWYLDDITIRNEFWTDLVTTSEPSFLVTGRAAGNYCYRVQSTYTFPSGTTSSPFSNIVNVDVAEGVLKDARLQNISARSRVQTSDNIMIGGFIISDLPKRVVVRAIGPSLQSGGNAVQGRMTDPMLELHREGNPVPIRTNDDWQTNQAEVQATNLAPTDPRESAIVVTLDPGSYTAVMRGKNNEVGIGLIEIYDIDNASTAVLRNLSARAFVESDDNVLIGGFIAGPDTSGPTRVVVRALGPSLKEEIPQALDDTTLEVVDANGTPTTNDDWEQSPNAAEIQQSGLAPNDPRESVVMLPSLMAGPHTAVVRGKGQPQGVGVVEIYNLQ